MPLNPSQTEFRFGDSLWDLVRKILNNITGGIQTTLDAILVALGGGGGVGTSITTGTDLVCATAGIQVQGANVVSTRGILIVAYPTNTGAIYIGASGIGNASSGNKGLILLQAGMPSQFIPIDNLNKLYINSDNDGDGAGIIVI